MLNKNKVGVAVGGFLALFHFVWAVLVAAGWAGPFMDFVFNLHMMTNPIVLKPFDIVLAAGLIIFTAVCGYIFGWVFAWVYNWAHR